MAQYTIYDIAKLVGVSASTVSRVITNKPNVKKATRARVLQVIEKCHYVPNQTARGLVTQSSRLIGILIADVRMPHHADGVYYIERELIKHGYCCLILNTGTDTAEQAQYIQMLSQRKVDAAVLMGSIYQTDMVRGAIKSYLPNTPVILCNGYLDLPNTYGLMADEQAGVEDCVQLLHRKGRRHPAFVLDRRTPSNMAKQAGFISGVKRYMADVEPVLSQTDGSWQNAYSTTIALLEAHPELDGIIYSDDLLASAGMRALLEKQISVPARMAVIGINNSYYAENTIPALTSLDNMLYDLSLMVARNIRIILSGQHVNKRIMICAEIVERKTT